MLGRDVYTSKLLQSFDFQALRKLARTIPHEPFADPPKDILVV